VHKLRNFVDSKRDVGASEGEILEGANKTSVGGGVIERIPRE
jgi:hypothetical protein